MSVTINAKSPQNYLILYSNEINHVNHSVKIDHLKIPRITIIIKAVSYLKQKNKKQKKTKKNTKNYLKVIS